MAIEIDAVDCALANLPFADGILQNLRHDERDLAREQRLLGLKVDAGKVEIRRAQIQGEPGLAWIFVPLSDDNGK